MYYSKMSWTESYGSEQDKIQAIEEYAQTLWNTPAQLNGLVENILEKHTTSDFLNQAERYSNRSLELESGSKNLFTLAKVLYLKGDRENAKIKASD